MVLLRFDQAGNVIERIGASSFGLARYGGTCPKWNIWQAGTAHGSQMEFVEMGDGEQLFSMAFAVHRRDPALAPMKYPQLLVLVCAADKAMETTYGRQLGEARQVSPTRIGASCRLCERSHCAQRSAAPLLLGQGGETPNSLPDNLVSYWSGE
jgi:predicted transcriptional regulator